MAESDAAKSTENSGSTGDSPMLGLKAVMIGATGAVGKYLLAELLASKNFAEVVVLGRRNATIPESYGIDQKVEEESGRLKQHTIDFDNLSKETVGQYFTDKHAFFCTLGTTRKQAGSAAVETKAFFIFQEMQAFEFEPSTLFLENYRHIEYDIVVSLAEIAKQSDVKYMGYVSSQGAKSSSCMLLLKTKGQVEEALKNIAFERISIYRPGLIEREELMGKAERIASYVMKAIPTSTIGKAMAKEAENYFCGHQPSEEGGKSGEENVIVNFNAEIYKVAEPTGETKK